MSLQNLKQNFHSYLAHYRRSLSPRITSNIYLAPPAADLPTPLPPPPRYMCRQPRFTKSCLFLPPNSLPRTPTFPPPFLLCCSSSSMALAARRRRVPARTRRRRVMVRLSRQLLLLLLLLLLRTNRPTRSKITFKGAAAGGSCRLCDRLALELRSGRSLWSLEPCARSGA